MVEPSALVVVTGITVSTDVLAGVLLAVLLVVPPLFPAVELAGAGVLDDCCCGVLEDCCCGVVDDCCCGVVDDCCAGVELVTPVPAACLLSRGMMPSGISSALMDAKLKRRASIIANSLALRLSIEIVVVGRGELVG